MPVALAWVREASVLHLSSTTVSYRNFIARRQLPTSRQAQRKTFSVIFKHRAKSAKLMGRRVTAPAYQLSISGLHGG